MGWTKKEGQEIQNNLSLKPGGKSYKIASSFNNVNSIQLTELKKLIKD